MLELRFAESEDDLRRLAERSGELLAASGSTFLFGRPAIPALWWKHFRSDGAADFGERRGRNFLGVKTRLERPLFLVAEEAGALRGLAALVESSVTLRANAPPLRLLSFCADSVILFYQDLVIHPEGREATIAAMVDRLAAFVREEGMLLFLGHIPEESPNLAALARAVKAKVAQGWKGGVAENRFRGGAYPWSVHKLAKAVTDLRDRLPEGDAGRAELEALAAKLEAQGPALLGFAGTRLALEKQVKEAAARFEKDAEADDARRRIAGALEGGPIQYPNIRLPATPEAYLESLSSSRRYYFRRYLRKFLDAGGEFEDVAPASVTAADIEEFLDLHQERWGADSVAVNPATLGFHRELAQEAARQGLFRLFFARHGGKRICAHVCLDIGERREYFFSGRTSASEELRAGKLLVMHTVQDAIKRGFAFYDFGYGGDEYKADFTKTWRTVRSLFLHGGPEMPDLEKLFPKYECMGPLDA
jgi:hypothetical protein